MNCIWNGDPVEIENAEISKALCTKIEKLNKNTVSNLQELHGNIQKITMNFLNIPPLSSFQPKPSNHSRQAVIL